MFKPANIIESVKRTGIKIGNYTIQVESFSCTSSELTEIYKVAGDLITGQISMKEAVFQLRTGDLKDWVAAMRIINVIITVAYNINVEGFHMPDVIRPPHLVWLYRMKNKRPSSSKKILGA